MNSKLIGYIGTAAGAVTLALGLIHTVHHDALGTSIAAIGAAVCAAGWYVAKKNITL